MTETMAPKALLELAERERRLNYDDDRVEQALRSYAELVSALVYLDKAGASLVPSTVHLRFGTKPETVLFVAKDRGWPGLEEL